MVAFTAALIGACWGSFLNVVAHRSIIHQSLRGRSRCPRCGCTLSITHMIPMLSWIFLHGTCAHCSHPISSWYPCIELLTALWFSMVVLFQKPSYWPLSLLFGSLMIITIRTDGEHMLILTALMRFGTIVALGAAYCFSSPLSLNTALAGGIIGFSILAIARFTFTQLRGHEGIGWGDIELLTAIGTYVGPYGVWLTLLFGSFAGSIYGIGTLLHSSQQYTNIKLPFGLFLAGAGLIVFLWGEQILDIVLFVS